MRKEAETQRENEEEEVKHILKMWETLHRMFLALRALEVL